MASWQPLPIGERWFSNVKEAVLSRATAAIENGFVNAGGGISRFFGLRLFCNLPSPGRVFLNDWKGDQGELIAVTGRGRFYRVDRSAHATDVTGVPLSGGNRPVFTKTDDELLTAAGGPILKYSGKDTQLLSDDAPDSTHVGYIDGYTVAIEAKSQRFQHTQPGQSSVWDPLDVFTAEGKPDNLNGLIVTSFRELLLTGEDSVEQFERLPSGERPFVRRWATGEGILAPYTLVTDVDAGTWGVNKKSEFVRMSGQSSKPVSDDIGRVISGVMDWTEAWATHIHAFGQKFLLVQIPNAVNPYGTLGLTLGFDYVNGRWTALYGWDAELGLPRRWPGWSAHRIWGRTFVGGEGKIYELSDTTYDNAGETQRFLHRTANYKTSAFGFPKGSIEGIRACLKRGSLGSNDPQATIGLRLRRDGHQRWSKWVRRTIGRAGDTEFYVSFGKFGNAETFQVEVEMTDAAELELVRLEGWIEPLSR